MFSTLVFLFPTVAVYYFLFSVCRLSVILVQACIDAALQFINHFPLFALMLRVKDHRRFVLLVNYGLEFLEEFTLKRSRKRR
jgi:hypothetical protein